MADDISSLIVDGSEYRLIDSTAVHNVDSALSSSSTNPVQNKVVKAALDGKEDIIDIGTISVTGASDTYIITSIPAAGQTLLASLAAPCDVAFTATIDSQSLYFVGSYNGDETVNNGTYKVVSGTIKNGFSGAKTFVAAFNNSGSGTLNLIAYAGSDTTYTFTGGTQSFTATPSSGTAQTVDIKPQIFKGTCSTAAGTTAKVVTCPEFTSEDLVVGAVIFVTFTQTNTGERTSLTLNVNGTGARSIKCMRNSSVEDLPGNGYLVANMTYTFVASANYWLCDPFYDMNTLAYELRSNASSKITHWATYRKRILFTTADGTMWVPATGSTSSNATSTRNVTQIPIDPFGEIVYYNSTDTVAADTAPAPSTLYRMMTLTLGYSFNRTGEALTLTTNLPIYIKCAPQSNGSAIIDANVPYVQALPSTADGKIYIFLGYAYSATTVELMPYHPVYYYRDGAGIALWTGVEYAADFDVLPISRGGTQATSFTSGKVIYYSGVGLASSNTDNSKLQYINNVTSDIQEQIDSLSGGGTYTFTGGTQSFTATSSTGTTQTVDIKPQIFKGTCSTAAATTAKDVTCPEFTSADLVTGAVIFVTFTATNGGAVGSLTLNVNGTGAKSIKYMRNAAESNLPDVGYLRANMTYRFVYNNSSWVCDTDYDSGDALAYRIRHNSSTLPVSGATYRYRILFTSADGTKYVPSNTSSSTNATSARAVNQTPINPFGEILYYSSTTAVSSGSNPSASSLWSQYAMTFGYSFNRTGAALVLTYPSPIYIKCAPQSDGSAIIDADNPYVQALPSTADGKIYIFLGVAYSATAVEMLKDHPVYYYKTGVGVMPWTGIKYASDFDVLPISRGGTQATSFTSDKVIYYSGVGLASSGTDYSKLQYLDNVTSDIQQQINAISGDAKFVLIRTSQYDFGSPGVGNAGIPQTFAALISGLQSPRKYAVIYDDGPFFSNEDSYFNQVEDNIFESWDASGNLIKVTLDLVNYDYVINTFAPASSTHTHGDIGTNGALTTNPAIAADDGDAIVIVDSGNGNAIKKSSITFDTSNTSDYLRKDGTWATPGGSVPSDNITGSGTSGNIAKFDGANSITDGPAFGSDTTTFLRNDGEWAVPAGGGGGGSIDEVPFLICSTAVATQNKTVEYTGFTLSNCKRVYVQFTKGNSANQPTLNVNSTGAYPILYSSQQLRSNARDYLNGCFIQENQILELMYYNNYWRILSGWNNELLALNANGSGRLTNCNRSSSVGKLEYFLATSSMTTGKPTGGDSKVLQMNWDNNTIYASQLACGLNNATHSSLDRGWVQYRCQNGALDTWTDWMDLAIVRTGTMTITDNDATDPSSDTWNYMKIGQQVTVWGQYTGNVATANTLSGFRYTPLYSGIETVAFEYQTMGLKIGTIRADVTLSSSSTDIGVKGYTIASSAISYSTGSWLSYAKASSAVIKFTYLTND